MFPDRGQRTTRSRAPLEWRNPVVRRGCSWGRGCLRPDSVRLPCRRLHPRPLFHLDPSHLTRRQRFLPTRPRRSLPTRPGTFPPILQRKCRLFRRRHRPNPPSHCLPSRPDWWRHPACPRCRTNPRHSFLLSRRRATRRRLPRRTVLPHRRCHHNLRVTRRGNLRRQLSKEDGNASFQLTHPCWERKRYAALEHEIQGAVIFHGRVGDRPLHDTTVDVDITARSGHPAVNGRSRGSPRGGIVHLRAA
jgi:hypothetical protein